MLVAILSSYVLTVIGSLIIYQEHLMLYPDELRERVRGSNSPHYFFVYSFRSLYVY